MSKYKNKKTTIDNITFDSKKEATRYTELKLMERGKVIKDLQLQPSFNIVVNKVKICKYKADFSYLEGNKFIVEDVKSKYTRKLPVYRLKMKLIKALYDIDITEV